MIKIWEKHRDFSFLIVLLSSFEGELILFVCFLLLCIFFLVGVSVNVQFLKIFLHECVCVLSESALVVISYFPCLFTYLQKRPVTLEQNLSPELVTKILTKIRSSRTSCSFFLFICSLYCLQLVDGSSRPRDLASCFGKCVIVPVFMCVCEFLLLCGRPLALVLAYV